MNYEERTINGKIYIESMEGEIIKSERDALDLIGAAGECGACGVLLHNDSLNEDFYNLRTGLAGAVLQKFGQYGVRLAAIIPPQRLQGHFGEMVWESNRGNQFRTFVGQNEAVRWLLSGQS